jgi:hypothetical protein
LSEFQLRDFGVKIDSICHKHGGTQKMVIQDVGSSLVVPLELAGCMIHFKHRLPTTEEINSFRQYCLTQGDTPWNPSSFSDQVASKKESYSKYRQLNCANMERIESDSELMLIGVSNNSGKSEHSANDCKKKNDSQGIKKTNIDYGNSQPQQMYSFHFVFLFELTVVSSQT